MNKSKQLREQIKFCKCEHGKPCSDTMFEIEKALTNQRKAILEEVRSVLPKEIENRYGMISPDVGYKQAIKEMRQKLSTLEGKQND